MINYIYLSEDKIDFSASDLAELTNYAAKRNKDASITGYLWYHNKRFVQYIEGPKLPLTMLMMNIESDDRHEVLVSSIKKDLNRRIFPGWNMRHFKGSDLDKFRFEALIEMNLSLLQKDPFKEQTKQALWQQFDTIAKHRQTLN